MSNPTTLRLTGEEGAPAAGGGGIDSALQGGGGRDAASDGGDPGGKREVVGPGTVKGRGRWTLPLKTTVILLMLLMGAVGLCGAIFLHGASTLMRENKTSQVLQFAYGVAAAMGDRGGQAAAGLHEAQLMTLEKTPGLEFAVLTDLQGRKTAGFIGSNLVWAGYKGQLAEGEQSISRRAGQVREFVWKGHLSYVVSVPVFELAAKGEPTVISGYLHIGSGGASVAAQQRYLQASILLTCMAVVMMAVPIAGLIARHITIPIRRLAGASHALADGDLSHRVVLRRSDELGELAEAFNRMADTVQGQQEDIRRINAGLERKVAERTAELEKVNRRLTNEIAEKEDFLRAVSHDLNAPLRNISGMASMLMLKYKDTMEKDAVQRLERIQTNVAVECELINELLELSRIKTRREKIERVDLHELVTAVGEGFSSDFESKGIAFSVQGRLPAMKGERARMRQVFQNLVDNAVKYMRAEGPRTITVGAKWERDEVVMTCKDTGMGIAAEELPQLFHVFRRAKNASMMKIPGKGVGLASVKSIVENYHGRLWAESVVGEGTCFFVAMPKGHFEFAKQEVA